MRGRNLRPMVVPFTREHSDLAQTDDVGAAGRPDPRWRPDLGGGDQSGHPGLRANRDAAGRDCGAERAGRQPRPHPRRSCSSKHSRWRLSAPGPGLALARYALDVIQGLRRQWWPAVLGPFELSPGAVIYAFGTGNAGGDHHGRAPGAQGDGRQRHAESARTAWSRRHAAGRDVDVLIVAQVAVAVAVLPAAVFIASRVIRMEMTGPGFAAESIVVANAELGTDAARVDVDRVRARQVELMSRLKREPGVMGVTFSSGIPGFAGSEPDSLRGRRAAARRSRSRPDVGITDALMPSVVRASVDLFDTYGAQSLAGRNFAPGDVGAANAVVVNRSFAEMYLAGRECPGSAFPLRRQEDPATPARLVSDRRRRA